MEKSSIKPRLLLGSIHLDNRGKLFHINNFDLTPVKRIYVIENIHVNYNRGWKGHLLEKRWFYCAKGEIEIQVVPISCFETNKPKIETFILTEKNLDILFIPNGFATSIKQKEMRSRVVAMSDYFLGESDDENLRWDSDYFKNENSNFGI